jgi:hypothetical protein
MPWNAFTLRQARKEAIERGDDILALVCSHCAEQNLCLKSFYDPERRCVSCEGRLWQMSIEEFIRRFDLP